MNDDELFQDFFAAYSNFSLFKPNVKYYRKHSDIIVEEIRSTISYIESLLDKEK